METLPALLALICILLIITAGFIVFIKVADPLSNLIKTVINDVHATYKLGMESKKQSSERPNKVHQQCLHIVSHAFSIHVIPKVEQTME